MAAFFLGLEMGANGIETDVQRTRDGRLVLFHDNVLTRIVPEESGAIADYDYAELMKFDFGSHKHPRYQGERIVLLEDFLRYFSGKPIALAIELKYPGMGKDVLELIERYGAAEQTVITSFKWDALTEVRELNREIRLGFLTRDGEGFMERMKEYRIMQLCPKAVDVTEELVKRWHEAGFNVRAWGVTDRRLMAKCVLCDVDGMTVNFPDALVELLKA